MREETDRGKEGESHPVFPPLLLSPFACLDFTQNSNKKTPFTMSFSKEHAKILNKHEIH